MTSLQILNTSLGDANMLNDDFLKELIDLEPGGVMAYTPLKKILLRAGIKERLEVARERLPTALLCALQDEACLLDIRIVSENYPDLIPEIIRANDIIKSNKKLESWISYTSQEYQDFIEEIGRRISNQRDVRRKELRGSRFRCLMFTNQTREKIAEDLTAIINPFSFVDDTIDFWMPRGFRFPDEARLSKSLGFLNDEQQRKVMGWWLKRQNGANIPNWDIVSTCTIDERKGLILIEAKSYDNELNEDDTCGATNPENRQQIEKALSEANVGLGALVKKWGLSKDTHYQLSNRFAWAWKLANIGIPVILIYLGFINANEMIDRGQPFSTHQDWYDSLVGYSKGIVPSEVWEKRWDITGTPLIPLIRTVDVNVNTKIIK